MKEGHLVAGRFRIEREIGSGGMGIVYAAEDLDGGHPVALKVLRGDVLRCEGIVARFFREVRLAAQLRSKHAVRILGSGTTDGLPFMVMELLEGASLGQVVKARHRVAEEDALEWIADACDAIGEAHAMGVVHRDLKLANLFLALPEVGPPAVKVLDFGLAKDLSSEETSLTNPDDGFGTPQFMPPEQYLDVRAVDARSDVWALGVCLYRLVTGVYPVTGRTMAALCLELGRGDFVARPARAHVASLSVDIERVLARALAREKPDRFQDAGALGAAIRAVVPVRRARLHEATPGASEHAHSALID